MPFASNYVKRIVFIFISILEILDMLVLLYTDIATLRPYDVTRTTVLFGS